MKRHKTAPGSGPGAIPYGQACNVAARVKAVHAAKGLRMSFRTNKAIAEERARLRVCISCANPVNHTGKFALCLECVARRNG